MAFVERSQEMRYLRGLFERSERGRPQIALISGPVATGKTELLHAFVEEAIGLGALPLIATGSRAERSLPLGVIGQLFHSPALPWHLLEETNALLTADALPSPGATDAPAAAMRRAAIRLARGVCSTLLTLSTERVVVLAIDDVQYADGYSLQILLYLLRRLKFRRLLVILTEWPGAQAPHSAFRAELLRQPACHRLHVRALSEDGTARVLAEALGDPSAAARLAPAYHEVTGGNPLLLRGLVEDGLNEGGAPAAPGGRSLPQPPVPGRLFRQAVCACLYQWDAATIQVARSLALLDRWASPALVGRLTGMKPELVVDIVESIGGSGLLRGERLRHPAVRAAIADTVEPGDGADAHLRGAQLLHDRGVAAPDVAEHLVAADRVPDKWAIGVLRDAARQALAERRDDFADDCLELAQRSCADEQVRAPLLMSLTRLRWRRDPSTALRHLATLRRSVLAGHLGGRDVSAVAGFLLWHGRGDDAREILARARGARDSPGARPGDASQGTAPLCLRAGSESALPEVACWPGHPGEAACAALDAVLTGAPDADPVARAEEALSGCALSEDSLPSVLSALYALLHADRQDRAAAWCDTFLRDAEAEGATTWRALLTAARADIALRQGRPAPAELWAAEALTLVSARGWGVAIGLPLAALIRARLDLGRVEDAGRAAGLVVPKAMFGGGFAPGYLRARGHQHLAANRPRAAVADFERCGRLMREWGRDLPVLLPWRGDLALARAALDQREEAKELVAEQLALPGGDRQRVVGVSLRAMAAAASPKRRPGPLREAVALLQECGDRLELIRALADLSRAHAGLGEFGRARMMRERAVHVAAECGAEELLARLLPAPEAESAAEGGAAAEAADDPALLSDAERRVATLAAIGYTNREIGRKLHVTVSTVEQHLTRVYRKLNVDRRADLPLRLRYGSGAEPLAVGEGGA
ncbi:helix-turn-helix transcriptional regulator [Streptomyces radicis]|uniref:Helix-turn-helix transcriptional regulator n=1 Tax=Streptomyces radicis TaxID=1750517 RepID=A0A3A9VTC2_9ACTN|nr:LuxR family transcriptional regulator [Streptomyces radicis]RKN03413.1 helix-turn-helix transcriptional regulator [Streptomyces radicis]RKN13281.1 helix-turn-helix transcriptional regulator [Streptomyces radicis]